MDDYKLAIGAGFFVLALVYFSRGEKPAAKTSAPPGPILIAYTPDRQRIASVNTAISGRNPGFSAGYARKTLPVATGRLKPDESYFENAARVNADASRQTGAAIASFQRSAAQRAAVNAGAMQGALNTVASIAVFSRRIDADRALGELQIRTNADTARAINNQRSQTAIALSNIDLNKSNYIQGAITQRAAIAGETQRYVAKQARKSAQAQADASVFNNLIGTAGDLIGGLI